MDATQAARLGQEEADPLICLAQEEPPAGTVDPADLQVPSPRDYRDSPQLPARRVASEWDDLPAGADPFFSRLGFAETSPHVMCRLPGHAAEIHAIAEEDGSRAWTAYVRSICSEMQVHNVLMVLTVFLAHGPSPEFDGESIPYVSAYVADLTRYELGHAPHHNLQGESLLDERYVQKAFIPRSLPWRTRRQRRQVGLGGREGQKM